ncbi:MAG TPA: potassium channel protein [Candidatus Acidoferrales bacterium]|nr:potassium channel protein [Candidatus Acidoferrales bacterium]
MTIQKRLRIALVLIAVVLLAGTTGFRLIEGWPWFDGLYMTLITMTTIGYGETHPLSPAGRVFNAFLIITAVTAGGFLVASVTHAMVEFEFSKFLGRKRMERELASLREHYIICGAGRVGRTVAKELWARGIPFAIVERDPDRAQWALDQKVPVVIGTGFSEETLRQARIENAKGLVAAVTSDPDNLYIVLTASGLKPDLQIIARASEEEAIPKLLRAGASQVLSPYHFVGHRIVQLLLRPNVLDFIDTAIGTERLDIQIEEVQIPRGSRLAGKSLAAADIRQATGVLVLALKRLDGRLEFNPAPDTVIEGGDCLIGIGSSDHLEKLESLAQA